MAKCRTAFHNECNYGKRFKRTPEHLNKNTTSKECISNGQIRMAALQNKVFGNWVIMKIIRDHYIWNYPYLTPNEVRHKFDNQFNYKLSFKEVLNEWDKNEYMVKHHKMNDQLEMVYDMARDEFAERYVPTFTSQWR